MNTIEATAATAERPADAFSAEALGRAWQAVLEDRLAARDTNAKAILALAEERYLSPDDRSAKSAELLRLKTRIEDDLIILGSVLERARRDAPPAPKPEPGEDGLAPA